MLDDEVEETKKMHMRTQNVETKAINTLVWREDYIAMVLTKAATDGYIIRTIIQLSIFYYQLSTTFIIIRWLIAKDIFDKLVKSLAIERADNV